MNVARVRFGLVVATLGLFVGAAPAVYGAGWFDDFNDGSATDGTPLTWVRNLGEPVDGGFFPGSYDASSGDYILTPAEFSPTDQMSAVIPTTTFTDVYMRTQGKVLPDPLNPEVNTGGNLVLTVRVNPEFPPSGYLVYFDVGGRLQLQYLAGGATGNIGVSSVASFNASSEVIMELNAVGTDLSAFVWLADDPNGKPDAPQATASTNDLDPSLVFTAGISGIAYAEDDDGTSGLYRYAASQDTPFVDGQTGDHDGDGDVDGTDLLIIQRGIGGAFDGGDIADFKANFGATPSVGAVSSVPEPAGLVSMLIAAAAVGGLATRRPRR